MPQSSVLIPHPWLHWRGILFDLDGTLADSFTAIASSVNHVRSLHGLPPLAVDAVKREVGRGLRNLLTQTVPGAPFEKAAPEFNRHHETVVFEQTFLLPGAAEVLPRLYQVGLRLGVVSNKPEPFVRALMEHFDLAPLLDVMLGPESAPRPKPYPDMLCIALERMGLEPAQALYVGDMTIDIETARAAGVTVWVTPTGGHTRGQLEAAGPDRVMGGLEELLELVGSGDQ